MTNFSRALLVCALMTGAAARAESQPIPIGIGAYIGGASPRGDWVESQDVETGWGYGGTLSFRVLPFLGLYAGWDRYRFGFGDQDELAGVETTLADSGLRAGAEVTIPLAIPVAPFVMGGGYYGNTEFEIIEGDTKTRFQGGDDFGYEIAGGLNVTVGSLTIRPLAGYRTRDAELPNFSAGGQAEHVKIEYIYFTIGGTFVP